LRVSGAVREPKERAFVAADPREEELVRRAQAGDREALGELLRMHGPALYRSVLLPRLGSEAAAKDVLAEVYEKVVSGIGKFVWQNVGFYPWLRTVAMRTAIDHLRRKKRTVLFEPEDLEREVDAQNTSTPVDDKLSQLRDARAAQEKVEEALSRINPRYARAIRMRVLEDRPREEVAKALEVTTATFDVLLHRALAALKKAVKSEGESDE
jgi:RNA polymerase sigma-70 factor (ECF subfamily)